MVSAYIIISLYQAPRPHAQQNATMFGLLDSYMYMYEALWILCSATLMACKW